MHTHALRRILIGISLVVGIILIGSLTLHKGSNSNSQNGQLQVVAGENFWGSLVAQLGGSHVRVSTIVSDPNADPHEYESNTNTARTFATADYVILNGAGYDSWGTKLLGANNRPGRKVLTVADLLGKKDGDNPHFWYDPTYIDIVIKQIDNDLIALDPSDAGYYKTQLTKLQHSLSGYQSRIATIKQQYSGTQVAATEDIFQYLSSAAGLELVSPQTFISAVAEGNDPPTNSVTQFQQQLENGQVRLLVYNKQTVTPLTENMKKLAANHGIPAVGITETIQPANASFQDWMNAELVNLQNALNPHRPGR